MNRQQQPLPIIGLDIAKRTGWAHSDGTSGLWKLEKGGSFHGRQLLQLTRNILLLAEQKGCKTIVVEAAFVHTSHRTGMTHKLEQNAAAKMVAAMIGAQYYEYAPSTIKLYTAGSGRADKEAMKRAVALKYGTVTDDDNIADAVAVLQMGIECVPMSKESTNVRNNLTMGAPYDGEWTISKR